MYESLAQGGIHQVVDDWRFSAAQTAVSISLGVLDEGVGTACQQQDMTSCFGCFGKMEELRFLYPTRQPLCLRIQQPLVCTCQLLPY